MIIWFTGQPGSGKTTLATAVREELVHPSSVTGDLRVPDFPQPSGRHIVGERIQIVDGDSLRQMQLPVGYDSDSRATNVGRAQAIACWLNATGWDVFVALVSPFRVQRERFKEHMAPDIMEVYLHTHVIRGKEDHFVEDYQPPRDNFFDLDTGLRPIHDCTQAICAHYWNMAAR